MLLPSEYQDVIRDVVYDVTAQHKHLSSCIERVFREHRPERELARAVRSRLFQAVRYDDADAAFSGMLDGVTDPKRAHIPQWLRDRIGQVYGESANDVLCSLLSDAPTFVRVNTLVVDVPTCIALLAPFHPKHIGDDVVRIDEPFGLYTSEGFQRGWFEQQDVHSYHAACELPCRPGMRIVDACAGAGGKTLVFAARMLNKGRIIALDTQASKLAALRSRATRARVDIIETREITSTKVVKRLADSADGVFVDVPCTGTGVIRRNPDMLFRLTEESLNELVMLQADILRRSAPIAKVGASVVYATCSILPEEGIEQIHYFLASDTGKKFSLQNEWSSLPGDRDGDGFYVARLKREEI
jgi:16S rRNA (cytosine967-C5)-methyltransferase